MVTSGSLAVPFRNEKQIPGPSGLFMYSFGLFLKLCHSLMDSCWHAVSCVSWCIQMCSLYYLTHTDCYRSGNWSELIMRIGVCANFCCSLGWAAVSRNSLMTTIVMEVGTKHSEITESVSSLSGSKFNMHCKDRRLAYTTHCNSFRMSS